MIDIKEIKDEDLTNVSGGINSNDEEENLEEALNRFKRNSSREGILAEIRKREHYEKPAIRRKKKAEASRKRKY